MIIMTGIKRFPEYYNKIFHCNLQTLIIKDSKVEDAGR